MAIKETYLARLKQMRKEHPDAHFEVITATAKSVLSPSWELLNAYKKRTKEIDPRNIIRTFEYHYDPEFRAEIVLRKGAIERIKELAVLAETKDVYLVCYEKNYPCHRFIVKEMVENAMALNTD